MSDYKTKLEAELLSLQNKRDTLIANDNFEINLKYHLAEEERRMREIHDNSEIAIELRTVNEKIELIETMLRS